ncbi:GNAT family N-acetyltransferase [Skermania piniformis]
MLRYRLPAGYPDVLSDLVGELVSLDPPAVRGDDGRVVAVAAERVIALRPYAPRPIRTREIQALEIAAAHGWPGLEREWLDGWFLRAGDGFTGRANSAVPLGEAVTLDPLPAIEQWYAERGLPVRLLLPDRLGAVPDGWFTSEEVLMLAVDLDNVVLPNGDSLLTVDPRPTPGWTARCRYRDAPLPPTAGPVLEQVVGGVLGFGSLGTENPVAVARAAVTVAPDGRVWVGLTAVEVDPQHRRHGLGTLICVELLRWARSHGAGHAYLQVAVENEPALAMYRKLGFLDHHRYRYATPTPAEPSSA